MGHGAGKGRRRRAGGRKKGREHAFLSALANHSTWAGTGNPAFSRQ